MSRRADTYISWILILMSGAIFAGIVLVGFPRLLESNAPAEVAVAFPTPEPIADIATPAPTDPPPTEEPTVAATATPSPTATDVVETALPTEEPTPVPTSTATPTPAFSPGIVIALEDVIMFRSSSADTQTGAIFDSGAFADAVGRSADSLWVYIITISDQGWVPAVQVSFEAGSLETLPESDIVLSEPVVPTDTPVAVAVLPTNTPATIVQGATAAPTFPPPPPTQAPVATPWPTNTPSSFVFPTPVPTNSAPAAQPTQPPAQNSEPIGNAIAWWDISPGSARAAASNTWQVDIVVRVPTSFNYEFDMAHLWRVTLRDRNLGGDDYFVLELSSITCGSPLSAPLVARQAGVRMKVVNEFSVQEGPVFISPPC